MKHVFTWESWLIDSFFILSMHLDFQTLRTFQNQNTDAGEDKDDNSV